MLREACGAHVGDAGGDLVVSRYWSSLGLVVIGAIWAVGGAVTAIAGGEEPGSPMLWVVLGLVAVVAGVASYVVRSRRDA